MRINEKSRNYDTNPIITKDLMIEMWSLWKQFIPHKYYPGYNIGGESSNNSDSTME